MDWSGDPATEIKKLTARSSQLIAKNLKLFKTMIVLQANTPSDWVMFFGHFHPVVVHLPIGMLMIAAILELIARKKELNSLQPAIAPILLVGTLTAIISCLFGYLLSSSGEYNEDTLFWHQWMGIAVAFISFLSWYMKVNWQQDPIMRKAYLPSLYLMVFLQEKK